tara:strand:- start:265 stop:870 length:606 start_codon:yes stop_codon:yes gene_type:complete
MADPKVGTGKKPKGSDRRLYTDENPDDTVKIKFATNADAKATVAKVKKVKKPFARKIQILNVGQQRAKVMGKTSVVNTFAKGKNQIRAKEMAKREKKKETNEMSNRTKDGHNQRAYDRQIGQLKKFLDRKKRLFPVKQAKPNNAPTQKEEVPANAIARGGVDMAPNMGPRFKAHDVTDKRYKKDKIPRVLRRFKSYITEPQ